MANTGFKGLDVRQTANQIVIRALLQDSAGALLGTGSTTVKLYELQHDGTIKSYDFADNTFKTTALGTATLALTHRPGNNATTTTGLWTASLGVLTGFTVGAVYFALVNNAGATPTDQMREFQYGSEQGDYLVGSIPPAVAGAAGGLQIAGANAATTFATLTITGALLVSGGTTFTSTTGNGFTCSSTAANAQGMALIGVGSGAGLNATGGTTGNGIIGLGGATGGSGLRCAAQAANGSGVNITGTGTGAGINSAGGPTGQGLRLVGGTTSGEGLIIQTTLGDGINIAPTEGHAIRATANGTDKHGIVATGGTGGTSDGLKCVAGTGGTDIRAINITGILSACTLTNTTVNLTNAPTTGDFTAAMKTSLNASTPASVTGTVGGIAPGGITTASFAVGAINAGVIANDAIGAAELAADAVTEIAVAVWDLATAGHTTGGTFGAAQFAAPTSGDFTAAMKASLNASTPAGITGPVASIAPGGIVAASFGPGAITSTVVAADAIGAAQLAATGVTKIAGGVWDLTTTGHTTAGSFGAAIMVSATDDPWSRPLPGAYGPGQAGYIVGTTLDDTITSRSTYDGKDTPGTTTLVAMTDAGAFTPAALANVPRTGYKLATDGMDAVTPEAGVNARQSLSVIMAACAGVASGADGAKVTYKAANAPATTRITADVDPDGNRSSVILALPA